MFVKTFEWNQACTVHLNDFDQTLPITNRFFLNAILLFNALMLNERVFLYETIGRKSNKHKKRIKEKSNCSALLRKLPKIERKTFHQSSWHKILSFLTSIPFAISSVFHQNIWQRHNKIKILNLFLKLYATISIYGNSYSYLWLHSHLT